MLGAKEPLVKTPLAGVNGLSGKLCNAMKDSDTLKQPPFLTGIKTQPSFYHTSDGRWPNMPLSVTRALSSMGKQ